MPHSETTDQATAPLRKDKEQWQPHDSKYTINPLSHRLFLSQDIIFYV